VILGVLVAGWHLPLVLIGDVGPIGLLSTFSITLVYVWLFNRTGGSVLLTLLLHSVQGAITFGDLGFTGADLARQEWLECVAWSVVALGLVAFDRRAWRTAPLTAVYPERGPGFFLRCEETDLDGSNVSHAALRNGRGASVRAGHVTGTPWRRIVGCLAGALVLAPLVLARAGTRRSRPPARGASPRHLGRRRATAETPCTPGSGPTWALSTGVRT
jgi:hypothetical protein